MTGLLDSGAIMIEIDEAITNEIDGAIMIETDVLHEVTENVSYVKAAAVSTEIISSVIVGFCQKVTAVT